MARVLIGRPSGRMELGERGAPAAVDCDALDEAAAPAVVNHDMLSSAPPARPGDVLVLSGGGLLGAVQAGVLAALARSRWRPEFIVGSSAGALNGAWTAAGFTPGRADELCEVWSSLQGRGVFPARTVSQVFKLVRRAPGVQNGAALRQLIERLCPVTDLGELAVPLHVSTTDLQSGSVVWFDQGPAVPLLLASASVPGMVPPVTVDGRMLVDGGVIANVPVARAVELGARRVVCIDLTSRPVDAPLPSSALDVLVRSYVACRDTLSELEFSSAAGSLEQFWRVRPPLLPGVSPRSWDRIPELVAAGYEFGERFLTENDTALCAPPPMSSPGPLTRVVARFRRVRPAPAV